MAEDFLSRIIAHKKEEVALAKRKTPLKDLRKKAEDIGPRRGFLSALEQNDGQKKINIIAEVKRASPSKGPICLDLDPAKLAKAYEKGGAAAISVLTDETFFKGRLDDMITVRRVTGLPVLRKEFILSEYQVYESAAAGADALLLIVRILSASRLEDLLAKTLELGLDALVEVYSEEELDRAKAVYAKLIGINNRNLKNFDTDIGHAMDLFAKLDRDQVGVAASGITSPKDVAANLKHGIKNFLIGESLVRSADPEAFLRACLKILDQA